MTASTATLIPFPPARSTRLMSHVNLLHLDGRLFATAGFLPGDPGAAWAWIRSIVAAELECSEDDIRCGESDDGDTVCVEGVPVYLVEIARALPFQTRRSF